MRERCNPVNTLPLMLLYYLSIDSSKQFFYDYYIYFYVKIRKKNAYNKFLRRNLNSYHLQMIMVTIWNFDSSSIENYKLFLLLINVFYSYIAYRL